MTSKQKHTKLKNLSKNSKENLHEMLRLADELLADHGYVDDFGGEDKLMEALSDEEFSHFGGTPSLSEMLAAYRKHPDLKTWQEFRFNIWALIDLAKPQSQSSTKARTNWQAKATALELEVARLTAELERLREENAELRGELRGAEKRLSAA